MPGGSITTRLIVMLTACAALIIGTAMLVDYRLSRDQILEGLEKESEDIVRAAIIDLENWLAGVEGSTQLLARVLQQRSYSQDGLKQMLRDMVAVNDDIFGAAIALAPSQAGTELGFAPYYFRRDDSLAFADLAGPDHNYQQQGWYKDTVAAGKAVWVDPYFDRSGGKILMTTYGVPVYRQDERGNSFLYAVVTADVALSELHNYLQRLRLGASGFGILLNRSGIILSGNNPDKIMRHYEDALNADMERDQWQEIFEAALHGKVISRPLACTDAPGNCVMRLGALESTGWPIGVVYSEDEITAPLRDFQLKTGLISLLTLLLMALAVVIIARRLTGPLVALAQASGHIARGDLDTPLPQARGNDEVARLIHAFAAMRKDLKAYITDLAVATARRSRLEGELGAAREIQMAMLPHGGEASEQTADFSLWARVLPARSVGGDLYSYYRRDRSLFIAVGDVSDKGVPAALFMARAISLIQQMELTGSEPATAMAALNTALENGNENCMFVTLFLGILDLDSLELHFCSAGHTAPTLVREQRVYSIDQQQGPALGLAPNLKFPLTAVKLQAGDRLAIFTDGIDEAFNASDEMFGIERFSRELLTGRQLPTATAGSAVFEALFCFAGDTAQSDDISLLLLDINPDSQQYARTSKTFRRGPQLTSRAQSWLRETLAPFGLADQMLGDLALVLEEIVSNIDKYAELPATAAIDLTIIADSNNIALEVRDRGFEFNPLAQANRAKLGGDIELAAIGGLGLHLITALTDQQNYHRQGGYNILRVTKTLPVQASDQSRSI